MNLPILGGLFQVYIGALRILKIDCFSENYYACEVLCSSLFLKELFEVIKLWHQTTKLITLILERFLGFLVWRSILRSLGFSSS